LPVEQMNTLFKLSERLDRFCEILIATDELRELRARAAWLTLKLSHMTHPHVRTRMVHCTSSNGMTNTVVSAINMTTGQTIVLVSRMLELAEKKLNKTGRTVNMWRPKPHWTLFNCRKSWKDMIVAAKRRKGSSARNVFGEPAGN